MRTKTWYWRIWWWFGYHGLYRIDRWLNEHYLLAWIVRPFPILESGGAGGAGKDDNGKN